MKLNFVFVLAFILFVHPLLGQQKDVSKTKFLSSAPSSVKEYYRVFDSLSHPNWKKWIHKTWSDDELKKIASLIYDANDYDPIAKNKYDDNRDRVANDANIGYVTKSSNVLDEIEKRFPKKYTQLISQSFWLTIIVDDIETLPYTIMEAPNVPLTEKRIHGKVTSVWKGKPFHIGDSVTSYYMTAWNYHGLERGRTYIVALFPFEDQSNPKYIRFALGGPNLVQESVFPIEGEYVIDSDNVFGLGNKVALTTFTDTLTSTIKEIKSWKGGGQ